MDDTLNNELEDLITRHFDGHLDVAGQRRLAEMLAASADARQTFASYLRLEGAAFKLGMAPQLEVPTVAATGDVPTTQDASAVGEPAVSRATSPTSKLHSRWVRVAWLAAAASLLAALIVGQRLFQPRPVDPVAHASPVEMDRLAEEWLQLQDRPLIDEPAPVESPVSPLASAEVADEPDLSESLLDAPDLEADSVPPAWMIAALTDLTIDKPNPDKK